MDDVKFVLSQLPLWNKTDSPLLGKFDLDRIAVMGHSIGGAAVFQAAQEDPRIRAAVLIDASLHLPDFDQPKVFFSATAAGTPT